MDRGLPYCELYDLGYRSLGCVPCTAKGDVLGAERAGRDQDKERRLSMLHSLGYF
jgi:phosphoadenosine phosphosulfate reductase